MRVCFISFEYPPTILGGAGTYAENLVRGLRGRGVEVFVISKGNEHSEDQRVFRVPVSNSIYWRRLFFMKSALTLFHKLHNRYKFDIAHFNEPHVILEKLKLPTICTVHSTQAHFAKMKLVNSGMLRTVEDVQHFALKGTVGSVFDVVTAHAVDRIICPSPDMRRLVSSYSFVDFHKTLFVPNGIDIEALSRVNCEKSNAHLAKYGLQGGSFILFMGRLEALKGVQFAIEAFKTISQDHPELKMAIVGRGEYEGDLKSFARGHEKIVFAGHVSSLGIRKMLYENSLFVVVPSLYEILPTVILEAMAFGKAVIASNVGGIPLMVKNGRNGFLTRPGDSGDLARYMRVLYEDSKLREQMGWLGRKMVESGFSVERMVDRTLKVYESLCSPTLMGED